MKLSDAVRRHARALVAERLGLDFGQRPDDFERGLVRAYEGSSAPTLEAYLAWLATLPDESPEWGRLTGHLTVGETYFFRDRACFEALEREVLPLLITARRSCGILRLRLWSAGCATGEESCSLAILLDRLLPDLSDWVVTILATDINPEALARAERGLYREWAFREATESLRERYFHRRGPETFELAPRIRRMVSFAPLNLARESYPSVVTNTNAMDLILCRNVLMYLTPEAQRAAVARLEGALVTGGWLVVSPAETSSDLFSPLVPVNFPGAIFYRKEARPVRLEPSRWRIETPVPEPSSWRVETPMPDLTAPVALAEIPPPPVGSVTIKHPPVPPDTAADLEVARALANQGDLERALALCLAALARDRLDHETYLLLAAIAQERGEVTAALEALRRAIYLAPDSAPAHFLLGSLLLRQGQHRRGRRSMETVVHLLSAVPRDEVLPGSDGLTAGRLLETARAYLELQR